jgi:hypothetical protein
MAKKRQKLGFGDAVRIGAFHEVGSFAGRTGIIYGFSVPSLSGVGPVIGAHDRQAPLEDFAWSVFFEDTNEQEWFAPHLVELVERARVPDPFLGDAADADP